MKFTKMTGIGNDYVYINCFKEVVDNPKELAIRLSERHFGVGSDGIILIKPSDVADFCMDMYNADGSQAEMCGNGIRCVAKYVYDYGLTDKTQISVETLAGIKYLDLTVQDGKVQTVTVDMGQPILEPKEIPAVSIKSEIVNEPITAREQNFHITCVSVGNPHGIIFVEDVDNFPLEEIGPVLEVHPMFPNKANIEFIQIVDENTMKMRVWERGSGETLACGTGACASTVAAILNNHTNDEVCVKLLGGDLMIKWDRDKNHIFMTGTATTVFDGELL